MIIRTDTQPRTAPFGGSDCSESCDTVDWPAWVFLCPESEQVFHELLVSKKVGTGWVRSQLSLMEVRLNKANHLLSLRANSLPNTKSSAGEKEARP